MNTLTAKMRLRLSASFELDGELTALQGFTVLFGHSGAGKTSVLDCIAGIKSPDSGVIALNGDYVFHSDQRKNVPAEKRNLAYVFQSLALFPHLTVAENVSYGLEHEPIQMSKQRCANILAQFGIGHLSSRLPGDLSGGERQRVALARSLVTNPQALLLDEPLAALDRPTRMKILDDLRVWNAEHKVPILYVTHSVREALALGERVLLMKSGRIVASGTPTQLLDPEDWD